MRPILEIIVEFHQKGLEYFLCGAEIHACLQCIGVHIQTDFLFSEEN